MWVKSFVSWENVHAKKFHACDSSEIEMKIEAELGQSRIYINGSMHSKKSRKKHSHKRIPKKATEM